MESMPKQGSFLCHPERQRRIFAPSKVNRFFVTAFLRMTKGEGITIFDGLDLYRQSGGSGAIRSLIYYQKYPHTGHSEFF